MTPPRDGWLVIPEWSKWQSRSDRRDPWIKGYIDQLDRDDFLNLTLAERGLLESIRYLYARFDGQIRTSNVQGLIGQRVYQKHLDALSNAGYIDIVAAKPPPIGGQSAARAREEEERHLKVSLEKEKEARGASANGARPRPQTTPCPECGIGGGYHLADCPRAAEEIAF